MPSAAYPINVAALEGMTSVPVRWGKEEASMSYLAGALLVQDASSGELEEAGADPAVVIGVALKAASGVAGTAVPYVPFRKGIVFEVSCNNTVTMANHLQLYGAALASGVWSLDLAETTTNTFRIIHIPPEMIGVANPRVLVEPALAAME
jgi:hypothetical protein